MWRKHNPLYFRLSLVSQVDNLSFQNNVHVFIIHTKYGYLSGQSKILFTLTCAHVLTAAISECLLNCLGANDTPKGICNITIPSSYNMRVIWGCLRNINASYSYRSWVGCETYIQISYLIFWTSEGPWGTIFIYFLWFQIAGDGW